MAKKKLPDLDFIVDELLLEGIGGPDFKLAGTYAAWLLRHAMAGTSLAKHATRLVGGLSKLKDAKCRERTARALARHAHAAGDDKLMARIEKVVPGVRDKAALESRLESLDKIVDRCSRVSNAASAGRPVKTDDAIRLVKYLGVPAQGRGHARVDPGKQASIALMRVLVGGQDRGGEVRAALQAALAGSGAASHGARRTLIGAAAHDEAWRQVDALVKVKGAALAAAAAGLNSATYYRLEAGLGKRRDPVFMNAIAVFRRAMEPRLRALKAAGPPPVARECADALGRIERRLGPAAQARSPKR